MFDYLAREHQVTKPDDFKRLKPLRGGMMKSYGIALQKEILDLKTDERVVDSFRQIWAEKELTTALDSIYIGPPPERCRFKQEFNTPDSKPWFHTDQSSDKKGMHCIQSFINLETIEDGDGCLSVLAYSHKHTDQSSDKKGMHCIQSFINLETIEDGDGCLSVLAYSHKNHQEFFEHFNESTKGADWFILRENHLDWYLREKSSVWCSITAPKGSMVFWDSRTIHMGTLPRQDRVNKDRWRFIAYVCYTPARYQNERDAELKRQAYIDNKTTSHWPYGVNVGSKPIDDGRKNSLDNLSERHKRLIGITEMNNMLQEQEALQRQEYDDLMMIQDEDEREIAHVAYCIKYYC